MLDRSMTDHRTADCNYDVLELLLGSVRKLIEELLAATDGELETVDGVGEIRAKDIREGLRRQQEINLVDRYLQT